jgi:hypothetical protein
VKVGAIEQPLLLLFYPVVPTPARTHRTASMSTRVTQQMQLVFIIMPIPAFTFIRTHPKRATAAITQRFKGLDVFQR